jgi:hypothetical protein
MDRLINSDSTVTQLWGPITLRNPEDGRDIFSKTSVRTRATRYTVPEDIYNIASIFRVIGLGVFLTHSEDMPHGGRGREPLATAPL